LVKLIDKMLKKKLYQKLTVFSDGSLLFEFKSNQFLKKKVKNLDKDLKIYQKNFKQKTINNLLKSNNINIYRKKYF